MKNNELNEKCLWFAQNYYETLMNYHEGALDEFNFILERNIDDLDYEGFIDVEEIQDSIYESFIEFNNNGTKINTELVSSLKYSNKELSVKEFIDETIDICIVANLSKYQLYNRNIENALKHLVEFNHNLNYHMELSEHFKAKKSFKDKLYNYINNEVCKDFKKERIEILDKMRKLLNENYEEFINDEYTNKELIDLNNQINTLIDNCSEVVLKELKDSNIIEKINNKEN